MRDITILDNNMIVASTEGGFEIFSENVFKVSSKKFTIDEAVDFAKILASKFAESGISADIVTYVPTTAKKLKERRYNQSAEMAKEFAKLTNLVCLDLLDKTKDTIEQKELTRSERLKNLIGSIVTKDKWQVKGKDILVIDDVFTTGGTMDACAKALKRAGANKVYGLTVCKTLLEQNDKNI